MNPFVVICVALAIGFYLRFAAKVLRKIRPQIPDKAPAANAEYYATPLLTKYEHLNYLGLRKYAADHGLIICAKVRLADLIAPKSDIRSTSYLKRFNKIKAKHVDFVLCDLDMNVKLIVELDDRSHERPDRIQRDIFVDSALTGAGYEILHIHAFNELAIEAMDDILGPPIQKEETKPEPEIIIPQVRIDRKEPTYEEWKKQHLAQISQDK